LAIINEDGINMTSARGPLF